LHGSRSASSTDFQINHDAEMIAGPNAFGRVVECQMCVANLSIRLRMRVPSADEHVINTATMMRLTDDLVDHGLRIAESFSFDAFPFG
jgi:hypothetical protein